MPAIRPIEIAAMALASAALVAVAALRLWPADWTEVWAFITGGIGVWLTVRQHVWTWPISLVNNVLFFVLFFEGRLYADMSLQVLYFAMGAYGWWNWLHGGAGRGALTVTRTTRTEWIGLALALPLSTWAMREVLIVVHGASPLWDAFSTALSLCANFLLTRKRIENWAFWIAADLVYIPLYWSRDLPLTALLYGVFLAMCVAGAVQWHRSRRPTTVTPSAAVPA